MKRVKSWLFALVAAAGALSIAMAPVAGARTLEEITASKKLIVGVNPTLPPLGIFNAKNEIDGFDVDIAREIASKMGSQLEIVQVGSPDRIPFVSSGKIDMVLGAMTWTADRAKVIDFTVPVHTEVLGVLTTKAKTWTDWKQLDDPNRLRFDGDSFYFTSGEEMAALFPGLEAALDHTLALAERVDVRLDTSHRLPRFPLPEGFASDAAYLRHLAGEGLRRRYAALDDGLTPLRHLLRARGLESRALDAAIDARGPRSRVEAWDPRARDADAAPAAHGGPRAPAVFVLAERIEAVDGSRVWPDVPAYRFDRMLGRAGGAVRHVVVAE